MTHKGGVMHVPSIRALVVGTAMFLAEGDVMAAVVSSLPFTGRLTDAAGEPLNASLSMTFSFYNTEAGGVALWSQAYTVNVTSGRFVVSIGSDTNAAPPAPSERGELLGPGLFDGPTYLEVMVGSDPPMMPRITMGAMAFALRAAAAEAVECSGCISSAEVLDGSIGSADVGFNYAASSSHGGAAISALTASDLSCADCVGDTEVAFNYAGSSSRGGAAASALTASDLSCSACVGDTEVAFNYADSASQGGPANGLDCTSCVSSGEIVDGEVRTADIQDGSITVAKMASLNLTAGGNYLTNAYFARVTGNTPDAWTVSATGALPTYFVTDVSATAPAGPYAIGNGVTTRVIATSDSRVVVDRNAHYQATGTFRRSQVAGSVGNVVFGVRLFDNVGAEIMTGSEWWYVRFNGNPGDPWVRMTADFGAGTGHPFPANARLMTVAIRLNDDSGSEGNQYFQAQGLGLYLMGGSADLLPTGGTVTELGGYRIHTFTSSGAFNVKGAMNVDVLVVAGGGAGGMYYSTNANGGGGGGGVIVQAGYAVTPGPITVTVGVGGGGVMNSGNSANSNRVGANGQNSVFGTLVAIGGGGGGASNIGAGQNGGSGGGGAYYNSAYGVSTQAGGFGNHGGLGNQTWTGGGGGGAGSAGIDGNVTGNGGAGIANAFSGTTQYYGGGGGGGGNSSERAGDGMDGGGRGCGTTTYYSYNLYIKETNPNTRGSGTANAIPNTGGGGGGGSYWSSNAMYYDGSGSGGSGIVIVRYPMP
jgi:hypothetical protein